MPLAPFVVVALLALASVAWAVKLIVDPKLLATGPAVVLAVDLVMLAGVAVGGILVARGRWSRYLALVTVAAQVALAALSPIDGPWALALAASGTALVGLAGPWLTGWLRRSPSGAGPPSPAILLALGLLGLPAAVAVASPSGLTPLHWLAASAGPLIAWAYSRARPAGLWAARLLPLVTLPAVLASPRLGGAVLGSAVVALSVLAWSPAAVVAVGSLVGGRPAPLPHELSRGR